MGCRRIVASDEDPRGAPPNRRNRRDHHARKARRIVPALALIAAAAITLTACGGSSSTNSAASGTLASPGQYGKLPAPGTPTHGGTITYGQLNGNTPNYIFPVVPSGNASTINYQWQQIMWLPLYNNFPYGGDPGVDFNLSVANKPVFSDGDKTVTITLKQDYKWNDGKPVDAQDLLFECRADQGRDRRERRQLGLVHAGLLPGQPREHQRARASTRWSCI